MQLEVIASLLGTLITAIVAIIVALIQKPREREKESQPSILVPQGYKIHNPKKRNLWLLVVMYSILGGIAGYLLISLGLFFAVVDTDISPGPDGLVVIENQTIQVDNQLGKESLSKKEQLVRHYQPVIDLTMKIKRNPVYEDIIRNRILREYNVPKQQVCDIEVQVPPGQVREYQIEWTAYWQEGDIFKWDDRTEPIGTYKVVIGYACNILKDKEISP